MTRTTDSEWRTRKRLIDPRLRGAGWNIVSFSPSRPLDRKPLAVPTANGPADYALVVDGQVLGVVEAKKLSLGPQNALTQAERYSRRVAASPFDFQGYREFEGLRYHFGTSKSRGGRRYLPYAFTEQGVAMLSSVLRSPRAALVNIEIMRAFVRLRELIATNKDLAHRLDELEKKYDAQFRVAFDAIRQLMAPAEKARRSIGFRVEEAGPRYRLRRPSRGAGVTITVRRSEGPRRWP